MFFSYLILYYCNFDIGMFVLRSSISVQVKKKIFGIINKRGGGGEVQVNIGRVGKNQKLTSGWTFNWHPRVKVWSAMDSHWMIFKDTHRKKAP